MLPSPCLLRDKSAITGLRRRSCAPDCLHGSARSRQPYPGEPTEQLLLLPSLEEIWRKDFRGHLNRHAVAGFLLF
jgi:hypothetical protein